MSNYSEHTMDELADLEYSLFLAYENTFKLYGSGHPDTVKSEELWNELWAEIETRSEPFPMIWNEFDDNV